MAKSIFKTLSISPLGALAAIAGAPLMLTLGLVFGAVGDLALSRDGQRAFLIGLVAFALGHVAYVVLVLQAGAVLAITAPTIGVVVFALTFAAVLVPRAGKLAVPVAGYVAVIAAMGILALGLPSDAWIGTIAALMFTLSDALLGLSLFVLAAPWRSSWPLSAAIWSTYCTAQMLFLVAFGGVWTL